MWKVSKNYLCGCDKYVFQVYRKRNQNDVDHTGNREWDENTYRTKEEAQERADELNKKAASDSNHR